MTSQHNLKFSNIFQLLLLFCISRSNGLNPVIFVPGDGGSQVEAKLNKTEVVHYICEKQTNDFFNIWLNMELLVPVVIDCWVDNIKLIYDNVTRTTRNVDGVDIRIPGFGSSETVEWIDPSHASTGSYFNSIANILVGLGHVRNKTIRGAPYDFRKAPNENQQYFVDLKVLIQETYLENNQTAVILIAHSMGGPMLHYFLVQQTQSWKDKYIKSVITLSGAWGGSMKAVKVYAIGDALGSYVLRPSIMRLEQITSPSLAWLLPSPYFWKPDEVLIETDKKNFSLTNIKDFFYAISYPDGWEMHLDTEKYQLDFRPPGVEVHCLYGVAIDTVERLYYKPGKWFDSSPVLIYGDGDGTVNLRSLEGCLHWQTLQKQKIYPVRIPKVDHMAILKDKTVLKYIADLIKKYQ